jgi:hypothetical protein
LYRFPQTALRDALEWHRISPALISLDQESSVWITKKLEEGLNNGRFSLDNANAYLQSFGLEASGLQWQKPDFTTARNILGDGRRPLFFDCVPASN